MNGTIFKIERACTHDGPGLRTVVYLMGCPLRCQWCANIEGQSCKPALLWDERKCTRCGICASVKPDGYMFETINGRRPKECCSEEELLSYKGICPNQALVLCGKEVSSEYVVRQVLQDYMFYNTSGGGVTLSGGEVLLQHEFAAEILKECRHYMVHTAIETSGFASAEVFRSVVEHCDLVLMDLKHMDSEKHKVGTGVDNLQIIENARMLARIGKPMYVEFPCIPTYNDDEKNLRELGRFVKEELPNALKINVLPYHDYGEIKYAQVGVPYPRKGNRKSDKEELKAIRNILLEYVANVYVGGLLDEI